MFSPSITRVLTTDAAPLAALRTRGFRVTAVEHVAGMVDEAQRALRSGAPYAVALLPSVSAPPVAVIASSAPTIQRSP